MVLIWCRLVCKVIGHREFEWTVHVPGDQSYIEYACGRCGVML